MAQVAVGNLWGWTVQLAIPEEDVFGVSLTFLEILIPFAIALGYYFLPHFLISQFQPFLTLFVIFRGSHCWKCWKNSRIIPLGFVGSFSDANS